MVGREHSIGCGYYHGVVCKLIDAMVNAGAQTRAEGVQATTDTRVTHSAKGIHV